MKTEIEAPVVMPGEFAYARNYRSKPNEPWVLVEVRGVETSWKKDGTIFGHKYDCVRVHSKDKNDWVRGSHHGRVGGGGPIFLYVGNDKIQPLT